MLGSCPHPGDPVKSICARTCGRARRLTTRYSGTRSASCNQAALAPRKAPDPSHGFPWENRRGFRSSVGGEGAALSGVLYLPSRASPEGGAVTREREEVEEDVRTFRKGSEYAQGLERSDFNTLVYLVLFYSENTSHALETLGTRETEAEDRHAGALKEQEPTGQTAARFHSNQEACQKGLLRMESDLPLRKEVQSLDVNTQ